MRIRKSAANLNQAERDNLTKALKAVKTKKITAPDGSQISLYDSFVAIHLGVTRLTDNGILLPAGASNGAHNNAAFPIGRHWTPCF